MFAQLHQIRLTGRRVTGAVVLLAALAMLVLSAPAARRPPRPSGVATPVALTPTAAEARRRFGQEGSARRPRRSRPKKHALGAFAPEAEDRRGRARGDDDRHAPRLDRPDGVRRPRRRPGRHRLVRRPGRSTTRCSAGTPSTTAGRCSLPPDVHVLADPFGQQLRRRRQLRRQGARRRVDAGQRHDGALRARPEGLPDAAERVGAGQRRELQDRRRAAALLVPDRRRRHDRRRR